MKTFAPRILEVELKSNNQTGTGDFSRLMSGTHQTIPLVWLLNHLISSTLSHPCLAYLTAKREKHGNHPVYHHWTVWTGFTQ